MTSFGSPGTRAAIATSKSSPACVSKRSADLSGIRSARCHHSPAGLLRKARPREVTISSPRFLRSRPIFVAVSRKFGAGTVCTSRLPLPIHHLAQVKCGYGGLDMDGREVSRLRSAPMPSAPTRDPVAKNKGGPFSSRSRRRRAPAHPGGQRRASAAVPGGRMRPGSRRRALAGSRLGIAVRRCRLADSSRCGGRKRSGERCVDLTDVEASSTDGPGIDVTAEDALELGHRVGMVGISVVGGFCGSAGRYATPPQSLGRAVTSAVECRPPAAPGPVRR